MINKIEGGGGGQTKHQVFFKYKVFKYIVFSEAVASLAPTHLSALAGRYKNRSHSHSHSHDWGHSQCITITCWLSQELRCGGGGNKPTNRGFWSTPNFVQAAHKIFQNVPKWPWEQFCWSKKAALVGESPCWPLGYPDSSIWLKQIVTKYGVPQCLPPLFLAVQNICNH